MAAAVSASAEVVPTIDLTGPATYTPGSASASVYTLTVGNTGATTSTNGRVTTTFPAGATINWSCTATTGTGTSCPILTPGTGNFTNKDPGTIAQNGTVTFTFNVTFPSSSTTNPLSVGATFDDNENSPDNDVVSDSVSSTRTAISDLAVTAGGSPTEYTPGETTGTLSFTITNNGPSDSSAATFSVPLPTGATAVTWSCSTPARCSPSSATGATGTVTTALTLTDGQSVTVNFTAITYASSASANPISWTGTATTVNETDNGVAGNHVATKTLIRDRDTDYAIAFNPSTAGTYTPGSPGNTYSVVVTNNGPSNSGAAPVVINFPTEVASVSWTCTATPSCSVTAGSGNVATNVTLASGASATIGLTIAYKSDALTSPLNLVASVTAASGEDDSPTANNSATKVLTISRSADLYVNKIGPASVNPGAGFRYEIVVENLGPSDIGNGAGELGALLDDLFSPQLLGDPGECGGEATAPCWAYCPSDNGVVGDYFPDNSCAVELATGSGAIDDQGFALRAGSSSTLYAYVAVNSLASGSISNTATVRSGDAAVTDPATGTNNSDSVTTNISINTDINVVKSDGVTSTVPGNLHTYTITVRNEGFVSASNVAVTDTLPLFGTVNAGFIPGSIAWQCSAFDGGCCNTNSANCGVGTPTAPITANVLNAAVDLPGQSRVVFTVTGRLNARASGTLSNSATATLPAGVTESDTTDNTGSDTNTVLVPKGSPTLSKTLMSLQSLDTLDNEGPPYRLTYRITAGNGGPSFMSSALISDPLISSLLEPTTATWTCAVTLNPGGNTQCTQANGTGALSVPVHLDPGGAVQIDLVVDTTNIASGEVVNTVELTSAAGNASASLTSGLSGEANLSLSKTDLRSTAIPGDATEYVITVSNAGPDDVFGARVFDEFAPELEGVSWICAATTPVPGDLSEHSTVGAPNTPGDDLVTSSDGRHIYVLGTAANSVFVFNRDNVPGLTFGATAVIETEVDGANDPSDGGAAVSGMATPIDLTLSTDGSMLYVLSQTAIVAFNRVTNAADPNYGRLSYAGTTATGMPAAPQRIAASAQNLYVSGDTFISIYRRDAVSGLPVHDIQHSTNVPAGPRALAVSLSDSLLFVGSFSGQAITSFAINPTAGAVPIGRLTVAATLSDADFAGIRDFAIAPTQRHLYAAAGTAGKLNRLGYTTSSLTKLTAYGLADLTVPGGQSNPLLGTIRLALAPDGEHLISVDADPAGTLLQFRRDTIGGGLAFEAMLITNVPTNAHLGLAVATDVAFSSDGRHLFVASGSASTRPLTVYSRRAPDPLFAFIERDRQGDAIPGGTLNGLTAAADVVASPDGRHVYAVGLQQHALIAFTRSATSGLDDATAGEHLEYLAAYFEGVGGISGLTRPSAIQISSDGRSVYVTSEDNDSLLVFDRDNNDGSANFGRLTFRQALFDGVGGVDGLLGARGIALDHAGKHVYVAASFESAISIFRRSDADRSLSFVGVVRSGTDGVTGLNGVRDLVVPRDGKQLIAVGSVSNAVVAFNRESDSVSPNFGRLAFVQARVLGAGDRLVAIAMPEYSNPADNEHVYVVAESTNRVYALRRILDPGSAAAGTLQPAFQYDNNSAGITRMNGPRDVEVSPDGERVYVAAQFGHTVLVFDRDTNRGSAAFGGLTLVESRSDGVDGVDGLNSVYAIALSPDSRNVYAAGFGDNAVASFVVGTGSSCSAGGSGDIDDLVDIGAGGTLVYRAQARIRPDATGTLSNTATVTLPPRFTDANLGNNTQTDATTLTPRADLSVTKTNDRVSVIAGETVSYEVVVRNAGLSNIVHSASDPFTITDILGSGFQSATAQWSCVASGSGALEYVDGYFEGIAGVDDLGGVGGLALANDLDGNGPLVAYLAAVSVLDNSLNLFARDPLDGRLTVAANIVQGATLNSVVVDALVGARAVVASDDGRFLYVASRISDAVSVFRLSNSAGALRVDLVEVQRNIVGLDQALHLALSPGAAGTHLYVAGGNDDAIVVFARDAVTGMLTPVESEQNGVNDPGDTGGVVAGLDGVEFVVVSPDGRHVYALSGASSSIAIFARDTANGELSFVGQRTAAHFGASLAGLSSAVIDGSGQFMYVTAADANSVLVLERDNVAASGTFGELSYASRVEQGVGTAQGLLAPSRAALTADGVHLYVSARTGGSVAWFIRDPGDGGLRFLGLRSNESAGVDGLSGATDIVIDGDLNQVYVAGTQQDALAQFERQIDSFCPTSGSGDLNAIPLRIAAGGSVTFTINVQITSGFSGALRNTVTLTSAQDTDGSNNEAIDEDTVGVVADLAITKSDGLAEFDGLAGAVAVSGDDDQLYVAGSSDNAIGIYDRNTNPGPSLGEISFNSTVRSGENGVTGLAAVNDVLLSLDGDHIYATSPTDSSVATFRRNRLDGRLTFVEIEQNGLLGVTGLSGAQALAQSPDGAHVYVAGGFSNAVAVFARDTNSGSADYGRLLFKSSVQNGVSGVDGIGNPNAIVVAPNGLHVYVLGAATDSVAVFTRNPNPGSSSFGQLTFVARYLNNQGGFTGLAGVRALLSNAAGTSLYVLAADTGNLVRLARNPTTGVLTPAQVLTDGLAAPSGAPDQAQAEGVPGTSGLAGASRMRWSPGFDQIYVAGSESDSVAQFNVDSGSGDLSFVARVNNGDPAPLTGGQVLGLDEVRDLFVSADGAQLYSVSTLDAAAATFQRAALDGSLSYRAALFDGLGGVAPGESVTYLIVATNSGPSNVTGATVVDTFPDAFTQIAWTCTPSGGASCLASGNGSISTPVNLPIGGRVSFVATGVVGEGASGRLVNTVTINSSGNLDPNAANNSATDADTVLSPAMDLVVNVNNAATVSVPGDRIDYDVVVSNLGPTYASGATVRDLIPPALYNVEWSCDASPVAGTLSLKQSVVSATTNHEAIAVSALGGFVYTIGSRGGQSVVLAYQRNPLDGSLSEIAVYQNGVGGISGLVGARDVMLSEDERFVYVAAPAADAIVLFARNTATGLLSYVRQYQDGVGGIDGLGGVNSLLSSPGGAHLYAAGGVDDAIAVFSVNASTGALTQTSVLRQSDVGVDGLNGVNDLAWGGGGTHLLATAGLNESLSAFTRNTSNGSLAFAVSAQNFQFPASPGVLLAPASLGVHDDQVFVAAAGGNRVSRFRFTSVGTAAFALDLEIVNGQGGISGMQQPRAVVYDPDQARLYVVSNATGALHLFSLLGPAPVLLEQRLVGGFPVLTGATALALSHNGRQLYTTATSPNGGVAVWTRERGSRCAIAGTRQLGNQTVDIAPGGSVTFQIGGDIFANALGNLVYSVQADTRVATEELNPADNSDSDTNTLQPQPNLAITKSDGLTQVAAGENLSYAIDVSNAGVSDALLADVADLAPIYPTPLAGFRSTPAQWSCDANDPLAFTRSLTETTVPPLTGVGAMVLSLDGSQMFAVNPTANSLLVFARQVDGTLATPTVIQNGTVLSGTTVDGLAGASNLALTADGRHVLVTAATSNSLLVFSRGNDGTLRFVQKLTSGSGGVAGLLGATDVVTSIDGRRVFVASPTANAIAVFSRDSSSGVLSFVERVADGLGTIVPDSNVIRGVRRLHLTDDGLHLYAVATLSSALSRFRVNAATGKLTYAGVQRSVYAGLSALAGARDLVAAPGDTHLYALGSGGIVRFDRAADGALTPAGALAPIPGLTSARSLSLDAFGSRLYLSDASGGVHVIARDWSNGALDYRQLFSPTAAALGSANELLHVPGSTDLYVSSATPGLVAQLNELALSRCLAAGASQNTIATDVDLGANGSARLLFDLQVHPSARGVLFNTATVQAGAGIDPVGSNNSATDATTIIVRSDTSISKFGPPQAVAGEVINYRIEARNTGPSDALGVQIQDLFTPLLLNPTWTCTSSGASVCPAGGSGNINVTTNLLVGDLLTFEISARVAPHFVGTLANQTTLTPEAGAIDPTPTDHASQVQTNVIAVANASISKSNGRNQVNAGATVSYQIDVANAGPSDAPNVRVADVLPGLLSNTSWTCTGSAGATCPASGSGSPDFIAAMPAGGSVQLIVEGTLPSAATGTLSNTATATVQGSAQDPVTTNNSSTDTDPIVFVPDVLLQIVDPLDPFDPAGVIGLPYIVSVVNGGPSDAHGIVLNLSTSVATTFDMPPGCVTTGALALQCTIGTLISGNTTDLTFAFSGLPPEATSFTLQGSVSTTDADPDLANNVATQTTQFATGANVRVSISDGREIIPMGYGAVYQISVANIGSLPANSVQVSVPIPPQLIDATWTCSSPSGVACTASGSGAINDTVTLARGQIVTYTLRATVDPSLDTSQAHTVTQTAAAILAPGVDINLVDNSDADTNDITVVLFGNGFEDGGPLPGTLVEAALNQGAR